jgi:succinate dehydrogenase / fumarate reductase membrane anchor subunit
VFHRGLDMNLIAPIARVRGLGTAGQGTHHWWQQRLTAAALVPLALWFVAGLLSIDPTDHAAVIAWLRKPLSATLAILFVGALLHHAQLGLQVVIEDYVEPDWQKIGCIVLVRLLAVFAGLAAAISVLGIFIGNWTGGTA